MSRLRILTDEATQSATITASTTAGSLVASNLKSNEPELVWRATDKTATIALTWANTTLVGAVVLAWSNLTVNASVSVAYYAETGSPAPFKTVSGFVDSVLPESPLVFGATAYNGTDAAGVNRSVQAWSDGSVGTKKVIITISDLANSTNIQIGRLIAGTFHQVGLGASPGAELAFVDKSVVERSESGSVRSEMKTIHRRLSVALNLIEAQDSLAMVRLATFGRAKTFFVSLFPETSNEFYQTHSFVAHVAEDMTHTLTNAFVANTDIAFEEIL